MKRTVEIVLTSIGAVFNFLLAGAFVLITMFSHTDFFRFNFAEGFNEGMAEDGMEGAVDATSVLNFMSGFGWVLSVITILTVVAGILGIIFFKGNKRPKAASIILIVSSVILFFGSLGMGFLPAILYVIAGIMGLVRKLPQVDLETTEVITEAK